MTSPQNQISISEGGKRILNTVQDELFPVLNRLKELLLSVQKCRTMIPIYSPKLNRLESEYSDVSSEFFTVVRKLETPDILFENLDNNSQNIASYFQFQDAFSKKITEGAGYIEIIDRTLDRKRQSIENMRTFFLAVFAILVSLFWR